MNSKSFDGAKALVGLLWIAGAWLGTPAHLGAAVDAPPTAVATSHYEGAAPAPVALPAFLADTGTGEAEPDSSEPELDGSAGASAWPRAVGAASRIRPQTSDDGWISQHVHLRRCGHLGHELNLPPPFLS